MIISACVVPCMPMMVAGFVSRSNLLQEVMVASLFFVRGSNVLQAMVVTRFVCRSNLLQAMMVAGFVCDSNLL